MSIIASSIIMTYKPAADQKVFMLEALTLTYMQTHTGLEQGIKQ